MYVSKQIPHDCLKSTFMIILFKHTWEKVGKNSNVYAAHNNKTMKQY